MMSLTVFAIAAGQQLPETFVPKEGKVLMLSGVLMQQDGTNKSDVPSIVIQLIDARGDVWLAGTTGDLFFECIDHLKKCRAAWDNGEAPPEPNRQPLKNPSDPGLN